MRRRGARGFRNGSDQLLAAWRFDRQAGLRENLYLRAQRRMIRIWMGRISMELTFTLPELLSELEAADAVMLDALPFGVIGMALDGTVTSYNAAESHLAGLTPARVIGRHFFSAVAPCTNNFMVAHRFETEPDIDDIIDYVFTLRMQPTRVRLRLLKEGSYMHMFLVVERR
jgi:photoactive yellow protein